MKAEKGDVSNMLFHCVDFCSQSCLVLNLKCKSFFRIGTQEEKKESADASSGNFGVVPFAVLAGPVSIHAAEATPKRKGKPDAKAG